MQCKSRVGISIGEMVECSKEHEHLGTHGCGVKSVLASPMPCYLVYRWGELLMESSMYGVDLRILCMN